MSTPAERLKCNCYLSSNRLFRKDLRRCKLAKKVSGVNGKCVRLGYKPWKNSRDGTSLWELHQACTRMLRADYCGDGTPHTRDGTPVEAYDTIGIQSLKPATGLSFEAAWLADGAVCVRKVRIPEITTLEALVQSCPARLQNHVGPECTEERALQLGALVMNGS
jgi:hypothetical protein